MEVLKAKSRTKARKLNAKTSNRAFNEKLWQKLKSLQHSVGKKVDSVKLVQTDRS